MAGTTSYRIQPVTVQLRTGWDEITPVQRYQLLRRRSGEADWREIGKYDTLVAAKAQLTRRAPQWRQYVTKDTMRAAGAISHKEDRP